MSPRTQAAVAGAAAATVWGVAEQLDMRLLRYRYSDVALLGTLVTRRRGWRVAGFGVHALNGAAFGLAYDELNRRRRMPALALALVEHVGLFPLGALVDRYHPARGTREVPRVLHPRAFVQATFRHALFGALLGRLAPRHSS